MIFKLKEIHSNSVPSWGSIINNPTVDFREENSKCHRPQRRTYTIHERRLGSAGVSLQQIGIKSQLPKGALENHEEWRAQLIGGSC